MSDVKLAPSILAADFARLGQQVTEAAQAGADRIHVNCHCTLPDDLPMSRVHEIITELENAFKLDCPEVSRLLIHPEPATDNRR